MKIIATRNKNKNMFFFQLFYNDLKLYCDKNIFKCFNNFRKNECLHFTKESPCTLLCMHCYVLWMLWCILYMKTFYCVNCIIQDWLIEKIKIKIKNNKIGTS